MKLSPKQYEVYNALVEFNITHPGEYADAQRLGIKNGSNSLDALHRRRIIEKKDKVSSYRIPCKKDLDDNVNNS